MRPEMKYRRSFVTTSSAGVLLVLMIAFSASPAIPCPVRAVSVMLDSYRSVVRVYERARTWSSIARFWVDPRASAASRR
jgi:hypothetical protein